MRIIKGKENFGTWLKKDKYHLVNNTLADSMIFKDNATLIMTITQDDLAMMFADFKINGIPKCLVNYFIKKEEVEK